MALITKTAARARAQNEELRKSVLLREDAADTLVKAASPRPGETFDVFLCHAYLDAEEIKGVYLMLRDSGLSVYVDWIVDRDLSRHAVTAENADRLRTRIGQSRALLYATSANAQHSKWMPWELGFADGLRRRVAIAPLDDSARNNDEFDGREYLGLYPYLSGPVSTMYIHRNAQRYITLANWISGTSI